MATKTHTKKINEPSERAFRNPELKIKNVKQNKRKKTWMLM
jgi:hypothetical protein